MASTAHYRPTFHILAGLLAAGMAFAGLLACSGGGGSDGGQPMPVPAAALVRFASLGGDQEAPGNASSGRGTATFTVDPNSRVIAGTVTTSGIDGSAAHIHDGAKGVAGPVMIPLQGGTGGVWTVADGTVLTDAQLASFQAGTTYVNVHSTAFPGGEIRGQIELRARFASLTGAQEVPASGSAASGYAAFSVNDKTGAISGKVITTGLTGTAAHIHEGALGVAGSVIVPLAGAGNGIWAVPSGSTLTPSQIASWNSGALYVNVHSAAFPGGEIRGQINLAGPVLKSASMTGAQESPANSSTATGKANLAIDPVTLELSGAVTVTGMSGTASHIHEAPAGTAGPVILPLNATTSGTWIVPPGRFLNASQFTSFLNGNLYANVHSAAFPGGEIRGQFPATSSSGDGGGGGGGGGY